MGTLKISKIFVNDIEYSYLDNSINPINSLYVNFSSYKNIRLSLTLIYQNGDRSNVKLSILSFLYNKFSNSIFTKSDLETIVNNLKEIPINLDNSKSIDLAIGTAFLEQYEKIKLSYTV